MKPARYIALTLFLFLLPGKGTAQEQKPVTVTIPPGINMNAADIQKAFAVNSFTLRPGYRLSLTVYFYSESIEQLRFSGNEISETVKPGSIKVLLKLVHEGSLKKVFFIEASGRTKDEIISNLIGIIRKKIT